MSESIHRSAAQHRGYSSRKYDRAEGAFTRWLDNGSYSRTRLRLCEGDESAREQAINEIKAEYGNPVLLWIGGAFVSWLIGRLLDSWFPQKTGAPGCSE